MVTSVWCNAIQDHVKKPIKKDASKNVKKKDLIVDTNANRFVILEKNAKNSLAKLRYL